jgi:ribosomal-protein-alanine N-acetyltransferase
LFVSSEYRGLGIGRLLMESVIDICLEKDIEILSLEVNVKNEHAVKMYQDLGFIVGSIRKRYYDNKEDALLMILELGGKK